MATNRALRMSVPADMFARVEWYAAAWKVSTAEAARRLLAGGCAVWEAWAQGELERQETRDDH